MLSDFAYTSKQPYEIYSFNSRFKFMSLIFSFWYLLVKIFSLPLTCKGNVLKSILRSLFRWRADAANFLSPIIYRKNQKRFGDRRMYYHSIPFRQHETKKEEKFASILIIIFRNCSHPPDIHTFVEHNLLYYCVSCKLVIVARYKKIRLAIFTENSQEPHKSFIFYFCSMNF